MTAPETYDEFVDREGDQGLDAYLDSFFGDC
jgi:hypothetical protein